MQSEQVNLLGYTASNILNASTVDCDKLHKVRGQVVFHLGHHGHSQVLGFRVFSDLRYSVYIPPDRMATLRSAKA